jgi:hypothetical protein
MKAAAAVAHEGRLPRVAPQWRMDRSCLEATAQGHATEVARFSGEQCFGLDLAMDEKGKWLACYAQHETRRWIRIWDIGVRKLAREIDLPNGFRSPSSIAMSADGRYLALGDSSDLFAMWDWQQVQSPPVIPQPHEVPKLGGRGYRPVSHLAFSPDGNLLTTLYNGRACLWDAASGVQLAAAPNARGDGAVTVSASRMDLSCALRMPMEKRHACMPVSRSKTPNIFMPSLETTTSSLLDHGDVARAFL